MLKNIDIKKPSYPDRQSVRKLATNPLGQELTDSTSQIKGILMKNESSNRNLNVTSTQFPVNR